MKDIKIVINRAFDELFGNLSDKPTVFYLFQCFEYVHKSAIYHRDKRLRVFEKTHV